MHALRRSLDVLAYLSDDARASLGKRVRECGGLVLILLTVIAGLALATWSVHDPSLSHATSRTPRNLFGVPGAIASDLMMQMFGLASLALVLPVAIWGWRLITHRPLDRERSRLGLWALGTLFATAFASTLPVGASWPLPTGLGGVIGDALLRIPATVFGGPLSGTVRMVAMIITGTLAVMALVLAAGLGWRDPSAHDDGPAAGDDEPMAFVSLGFLYHGWLSFKARLARLMPWREPVSGTIPLREKTRSRVEPRFHDLPPRVAKPEIELDEEEEVEEEAEEEEEEEEEPTPRARKKARPAKPSRKGDRYELPPLTLLAAPKASDKYAPSLEAIKQTGELLEAVLQDFGIRGEIINAHPGPVVTLYELEPAPGIKSSRVIGLADDIARSMSAIAARVAVVSGRNVIGIELPNAKREKVYLREMLAAADYQSSTAKLPLCLGKTIAGEPVIVDLARMPHLLIAGTTGSGKSVAINTMILSLLYRLTPDQCRLIMIDPKMLELSVYDAIPHLLTPVVTDPKKAVVALKWAVREMEDRYRKMSKLGVRNIDGYNTRLAEAHKKGETLSRTVHTGYDKESGEAIYEEEKLELDSLPYIVVIVDEMADLMMVAGKDIEGAVQRLAQMARAAGIHVVLATQRPSVDVITGTIKANFPTRISFQVTSKIDSRTILGEMGAEQLLGQGDMLYMAGGGRISRVHGPFVADEEVDKIVRHLKTQGAPQYLESSPPTICRKRARMARYSTPAVWGRRATQPICSNRRCRSSCATRRPPPATSSGGYRSVTTVPLRSWSGWRTKASSPRLTTPENVKYWLAAKATNINHAQLRLYRRPRNRHSAPLEPTSWGRAN